MQIRITPGSSSAIFRQIVDQVQRAIATGDLAVGDPLPSVRALAKELVVNPNTVAKAYSELVREGVLQTQPGRGAFVAPRRDVYSQAERLRRLDDALDAAINSSIALNFSGDEIIQRLRCKLDTLKV